jgi:hypothetical protein
VRDKVPQGVEEEGWNGKRSFKKYSSRVEEERNFRKLQSSFSDFIDGWLLELSFDERKKGRCSLKGLTFIALLLL